MNKSRCATSGARRETGIIWQGLNYSGGVQENGGKHLPANVILSLVDVNGRIHGSGYRLRRTAQCSIILVPTEFEIPNFQFHDK